VLICLQNNVKHFSSILTHFIHQTLSNNQKSREGCLDDIIKVRSTLSRFEAEDATNGQKALQACENRGGIVCVEQLDGDAYERRPLFGEIEVKDFL